MRSCQYINAMKMKASWPAELRNHFESCLCVTVHPGSLSYKWRWNCTTIVSCSNLIVVLSCYGLHYRDDRDILLWQKAVIVVLVLVQYTNNGISGSCLCLIIIMTLTWGLGVLQFQLQTPDPDSRPRHFWRGLSVLRTTYHSNTNMPYQYQISLVAGPCWYW